VKPFIEIPGYSIPILRKAAALSVAATAILVVAASAQAQLVQNGKFTATTGGEPSQTTGQLSYQPTPANGIAPFAATDWTIPSATDAGWNSYTFLFTPGTATAGTQPYGQYGSIALWSSADPGGSGFMPATDPGGGNFIAMDGAFETSTVSQTINGLIPGDLYTVGFYWAAAQQYPDGDLDNSPGEDLAVSLGTETETTPTYELPAHGFSGWMYQSDSFKATSSTEVLSFLANGTSGEPPFVLLGDVSMHLPEGGASSIYLLLSAGICFAVLFVAKRKKLGTSSK
jgi:hypothetical protein